MNDQELRMAVECQLLNAGNREGLFADALKKFADLIRADESEACAEVIDKHLKKWASLAGKDKAYKWLEKLAAAIRARGNT